MTTETAERIEQKCLNSYILSKNRNWEVFTHWSLYHSFCCLWASVKPAVVIIKNLSIVTVINLYPCLKWCCVEFEGNILGDFLKSHGFWCLRRCGNPVPVLYILLFLSQSQIYLVWKQFQISLSCMFHLLRKLGLAALPFKPISSGEPHRRESLFQTRFSALIGYKSAVLSRSTHQAHKTQIKL